MATSKSECSGLHPCRGPGIPSCLRCHDSRLQDQAPRRRAYQLAHPFSVLHRHLGDVDHLPLHGYGMSGPVEEVHHTELTSSQAWTITHMHWPDTDPSDTRWESKLIRFMSPPEQTPDARKRFYFSLFYTVTHVFALLLVMTYWTIQVPNGHGHWPSGDGKNGGGDGGVGFFVIFDDGDRKIPPFKDVFSEGWFKPFCLFNLYVFPSVLTVIEVVFLNSMRRQEVRFMVLPFLFDLCQSRSLILESSSPFQATCSAPWHLLDCTWPTVQLARRLLVTTPSSGWTRISLVAKRRWRHTVRASSPWQLQVSNEKTFFFRLRSRGSPSNLTTVFSTLYGLIGMRENVSHAR